MPETIKSNRYKPAIFKLILIQTGKNCQSAYESGESPSTKDKRWWVRRRIQMFVSVRAYFLDC